MSKHDDMSEHDPDISALYRKAGDIEPPASLDEAVLTTARRAARQRRQRWMLPLSTAAVLMLSVTVLLKLNSEWLFSRKLEQGVPAPQVDNTLAEKAEPAFAMAPQKRAREAKSEAAPAEILASKPASSPPQPRALKAAPPSTATASESEQPQQLAKAREESADTLSFTDETSPIAESGMAPAEPEVLEPKQWIEKIRKLIEANNTDEALKELSAFRKHYPDYKLPDDLKSL